jgi:hypothetical protein
MSKILGTYPEDDFDPENDDKLRAYLRKIEWHPNQFTRLDAFIRGLIDEREQRSISGLKEKYHGKTLSTDEAAEAHNAINKATAELESIEFKTGKDHLLLKWGTLKSWNLHSNKGKALLEKYFALPQSGSGAMTQHDTAEQRELIIQMIDECDGGIQNDWDGDHYTKQQAKDYVMGYGNE